MRKLFRVPAIILIIIWQVGVLLPAGMVMLILTILFSVLGSIIALCSPNELMIDKRGWSELKFTKSDKIKSLQFLADILKSTDSFDQP